MNTIVIISIVVLAISSIVNSICCIVSIKMNKSAQNLRDSITTLERAVALRDENAVANNKKYEELMKAYGIALHELRQLKGETE